MPRHRKKPRALLDYDTIAAASTGDPDAMAEVLRHFDGFISKLATRTFRDANNVSFSGVDQDADTLSISASPVCNENCTIFVTNRIFDRQVEKTKGTHLHFVMKTI